MSNINETIIKAFQFRHACKNFDGNKAVSKEDFDTILEAAHLSPSSFGFEPWKLIVVQDEEIKKKLYPIAWGAQNSLKGASHLVILLARKKSDTIYSSDYVTHIMRDVQKLPEQIVEGKREAFRNFQQNDFNLLESDRALFDWASKQTYIAMANMLTTAAFLGIDSCPIEGFHQKAVEELLANEGLLDQNLFGVSVMASFGYRAEAPSFEKTRQPLSDIVIWK
ncbi:NAD(P)H-dependent oxidoreductase [Anaerocolumna chitinilytica]|uniref:NAD(P)H-dependent oxidoreductase n=1 Tax=Anaerocolumna chitinilytica TaxID=1727145 RepID=A0A7I8DK27_9FIRM|nr:NAD(P)H-dependent oxidoreductase [Anaerocolumna chitinilytica]BCJ98710.1 NAD(P)H-dependent oxidoreductase [Anaerocolumna chitinilytica]